jgi:hypothetical protein
MRKLIFIAFLPIVSLIFPAGIAAQTVAPTDPRLQEQPSPARYTVEEYLNGEMPGRKPSPEVKLTFDATGFAADRLYHVPAPGVHPRMLFAPEDLPRIREQLNSTIVGREQLAQMKKKSSVLEAVGTWEADCYSALVKGDLNAFRAAYHGPKTKLVPGPPGTQQNPLVGTMQDRAFLALIDDDTAKSRELALAAVTLAKYMTPEVETVGSRKYGEDFWRNVRGVVGDGAAIGFLYDFTAGVMTDEQRTIVRGLIAAITRDRYTLGMDLPHHWRNWNFIGMTLYFPLLSLSIEGEQGYEPRLYARGVDVATDYLKYSTSENGVGKEGIGYHTAGMSHTSEFLLAMANRGTNLYTAERFRRMTEVWLAYAMQPFGGSWSSSGDLGTFPPNITFLQATKFFYPKSAQVDWVYQNHPENLQFKRPNPTLLEMLTPVDEDTRAGRAVDYHSGADFGLAKTLIDETRGYLFTRNEWSPIATTLEFAARKDTTFPSHDHPDRGTFYFSALGRAWSLPSYRETETKFLNSITIDGRGQGYFAPPATWISTVDTPLATFAAVDLKYCYDWRWIKPPLTYTDEEFARDTWLEQYRIPRDRLKKHSPELKWERDPLASTVAYNSGYLAGDPRMWDEDSWVKRAVNNPVEYAYRTVGLVRGVHTYAMVMDDIRKDSAERLYEWHMDMPSDVEAVRIDSDSFLLASGGGKIKQDAPGYASFRNIGMPIPEKGAALLYVKILEMAEPENSTYAPTPSLETIELIKTDDLHQNFLYNSGMIKRLTLPSRSTAPNYKVLLYPYRQGEDLPVISWNDAHTELTVAHDGVKDLFLLTKHTDGRTGFVLKRGDATVTFPSSASTP